MSKYRSYKYSAFSRHVTKQLYRLVALAIPAVLAVLVPLFLPARPAVFAGAQVRAAPAVALAAARAGTITWSPPQMVDPNGDGLSVISCVSPTFCVAGSTDANLYVWNGKTWSQPAPVVSGTGEPVHVSCASTRFCMAISSREYSLWNGHGWSRAVQDPVFLAAAPSEPTRLSCPSARWCMAVGVDATPAVTGYYIWNRAKWSPAEMPASMVSSSTGALSCSGTHFCMAGGDGVAVTWNGHGWSRPLALPLDDAGQTPSIISLSCASAVFCMAISESSDYTWNGRRWSAPLMAPGFPPGSDQPVSCPSANYCVGVEGVGDAQIWDGFRWTPTRALLPAFDAFTAVSCPSRRFCAAVTQNGEVVFGRAT